MIGMKCSTVLKRSLSSQALVIPFPSTATGQERMEELAIRAKVGRVECNMPHCLVNTGSWYNGQIWTESLGCGTWAGNMISENINYRNFLNYTWLSVPVEEYIPPDEELFGDYFKKWGKD